MSAWDEAWGTDAQFRLLVDGVADFAIFLIDPRGVVVSWNPGAERLLGYPAAEIVGRHFRAIFTAEDVERGAPEHELATAEQTGRSEDVRWHVRRDGGRFWAEGVVTPLRDPGGALRCFAKLMRDRTDQKEFEELLRHRADALVEADERKNLFLATLAHELRGPLGGITNAARILRTLAKDATGFSLPLGVIERQSRQIQRLADDLMDAARLQAGKVQLRREAIDLRAVVRQSVEATAHLMESRRHEVAVALPPTPLPVDGDPDRLQQVFTNLLVNAARYTGEGGRVMVAGVIQGGDAVVRVEDNGVGIPPDVLPRIFELFTQAEPTQRRSSDGLGLGLSLVNTLVGLHGGSVQVRSDGLGCGSEFIVRLPVRQG